MSNVFSAPVWTPPIPPVASTRIPAWCANQEVAETVVAPKTPEVSAAPRSRKATFSTVSSVAIRFNSSSFRPIFTAPSIRAIVAGVTPRWRASSSACRANSKFWGKGIPWAMMVDSNAKTGVLRFRASSTSGEK